MAEAGVGAALVPRRMVLGHVKAARLACLSDAVIELPRPFVMISAHYKNRSRRMKSFQKMLAMSDSD
jgi:LysR family glycine cleavage system transcriptional activator